MKHRISIAAFALAARIGSAHATVQSVNSLVIGASPPTGYSIQQLLQLTGVTLGGVGPGNVAIVTLTDGTNVSPLASIGLVTQGTQGNPVSPWWMDIPPGTSNLATALGQGVQATAGGGNAAASVQVAPYTGNENDNGGSQTGTSAQTVMSAAGAGNSEYMLSLQLGRSDAGTSAITAACTDGTKTRTFVVPNSGGGGGNNITFPWPGLKWAVNTAVTCAASSGVTTFYASAEGYSAP